MRTRILEPCQLRFLGPLEVPEKRPTGASAETMAPQLTLRALLTNGSTNRYSPVSHSNKSGNNGK